MGKINSVNEASHQGAVVSRGTQNVASDVRIGGSATVESLLVEGEIVSGYDPQIGVRRFREQLAWARHGGRQATMVVIGDSLTEAYEPSVRGKRWTDIVQRRLAGRDLGTGHYVPASANTFSSVTAADWPGGTIPWTYAGTVTGSVAYGVDLHAVTITGATGAFDIDYFGDVINIHYVQTPAAEAEGYAVEIDGASVGTLEANGTLTPGQVAVFGTIGAYGFHTLHVEVPTGTLTLEGVSYSDNVRFGFGIAFDSVRVIAAGHAGFSVPFFTDTDTWADSLVTFGPQCVAIALGTNDTVLAVGEGGTPAEFKAGLKTMMDSVDAAFTAGSVALPDFLFIQMPGLPDEWVDAAWEAATEFRSGRASVLDLASKAGFTAWGNFSDGGHPNDGGQQWIADRVVELVDPTCPPMPARFKDELVHIDTFTPATRRVSWTETIQPALPAVVGDTAVNRIGDQSGGGTTVGERIHRVWLEPGVYSGWMRYRRNTSNGTAELLIGGQSMGTIDTSGTVNTAVSAFGSTATITVAGWYPVVIRKTAVSGLIVFSGLWLRRVNA